MKKGLLIASALLLVAAGLIFMSMDRKKPKLKGTVWQYVEKMFVADAGTQTNTYILEFKTDKDVEYKIGYHMPPFPKMYMNPDGTVDRDPGWSSDNTYPGTYKFKKGMLFITFQDMPDMILDYRDGKLVDKRRSLSNEERIFTMLTNE